METPGGGREFFAAYDDMLTYNDYVDLFRPIGAYPGWGLNQANEFIGYPTDAQLRAAYGFGWRGYALTITLAAGPPWEWCGTILESDIAWSPYRSWTDNYFIALDNGFLSNLYPVTMHELGHTVGLSRAGFLNSRIPVSPGVLTLPTTGTYTIEVTSATVGATGTFTLSLMGSVALTVTPDPVAGSCRDAIGTIKLGTPAPAGGLIVALIHNLTAAAMPATVTVPAGGTSKSVAITTTAVAANQTGTISANWGSRYGVIGTDSLTIRPIQPLSLVLSPSSVNEGSSSTGTVTLECAAPSGGITLTLSSSKPLKAQPASSTLTIPAGSPSATFQVDTFDISSTSTATIKATANGKTRSATLTINPVFQPTRTRDPAATALRHLSLVLQGSIFPRGSLLLAEPQFSNRAAGRSQPLAIAPFDCHNSSSAVAPERATVLTAGRQVN
jgi:hypothetical protein